MIEVEPTGRDIEWARGIERGCLRSREMTMTGQVAVEVDAKEKKVQLRGSVRG